MNELSFEPLHLARSLPPGWEAFRSDLPHQSGEMQKRNWGHSWHSLCSYQGKLKPAIAHTLVAALMPEHPGRLLDPFGGVGTIGLEARLLGHRTFSFDISPAAVAISKAKIEALEASNVWRVLYSLAEWIHQDANAAGSNDAALKGISFNGQIADYFHPRTLAQILSARRFFSRVRSEDPASAFVLGCLLHILHGNRPYALSRRSHPITPFAPTGPFEHRPLVERLEQKVRRALAAATPPDTRSRVFRQDVTSPWPVEVESLDAIITSPPFFDSTRFYSANWLRLWFAGWDAADFKSLPQHFVEVRQKKSFEVYDVVFRQAAERLRPGGYLALHLGRSGKCDMAALLREVGARHLRLLDQFTENVEHCESHGIRDKGTVTHHQYLLFSRN